MDGGVFASKNPPLRGDPAHRTSVQKTNERRILYSVGDQATARESRSLVVPRLVKQNVAFAVEGVGQRIPGALAFDLVRLRAHGADFVAALP